MFRKKFPWIKCGLLWLALLFTLPTQAAWVSTTGLVEEIIVYASVDTVLVKP